MSEYAYKTQYREEFIEAFEQRTSLLGAVATKEAVISGASATFLVAGSGGAEAKTRGANGLIPARADDNDQLTCNLAEWHDLVRKPRFNVFASQGNQSKIMQMTTMKVINKKIDQDIIAQLATATIDTGAAQTASLDLVTTALGYLGYADVPLEEEDNLFGVVTPGFMSFLTQLKEFASKEYVDVPMIDGATRRFVRWAGVNWIKHSKLPGAKTSAEKCFIFHRDAIGHAVDKGGIQAPIGYDEEQDYSWCRASVFMGSKLLQNTGVVTINHNGSKFALA